MYKSISIKTLLISFLLISQWVYAHTTGGVVIKDAWVREAPPTAKVMAAYMIIENHSDKRAILKSINTATFQRVEIHKNVQKNGMAAMQKQQQLVIPAQGHIDMQAQGYHLMLFNPSTKLRAGDTVNFSLKFADGKKSLVAVKVKKATGSSEHNHEQMEMDHDHMDHSRMDHDQIDHDQMDQNKTK